jgi:hypothetical protein
MASTPLLLSVFVIAVGFVLLLLTGGVVYVAFVRLFGKQILPRPTNPRQGVTERKPLSFAYRVPSTLIFRPSYGVRLLQVAIPGGSLDIELSTRYVDGWGDVEPEILVEARGSDKQGTDPREALHALMTNLVSALSFSGNGWVGRLAADRDHQSKDGEDRSAPRLSGDMELVRELDEESTGALLECIGAHPDADEVWEALNCYRLALETWGLDQQSSILAHLHRGILTMSGVVGDKDLPGRVIHADANVDENAHVDAAFYLRSSIIKTLELREPYRSRLLEPPYDVPLGLRKSTIPGRLRARESSSDRALARPREPRLDPGFGT